MDWEITYNQLIGVGNLPVSSYYRNITFWSDPAATLQRSNDTHNIRVDFGEISRLNLRQEEYFLDWSSLSANSQVSQGFDYQLIVPDSFNDQQSSEFVVTEIVSSIVQNATSQDAYTVASTLSEFLREGNETYNFNLYHTPTPRPTGVDVTSYLINNGIGQCSDYNTAFVTMARLAGLPARYVTGYVGGEWNGCLLYTSGRCRR